MHEHLTFKTKELHEKYKKLKEHELENIKKIKKKEGQVETEEESYKKIILEDLEKQKQRNHEKYDDLKKKELEKIEMLKSKTKMVKYEEEKYKKELIDKLEKQKYKDIEETVRKQSGIIKDQLKKEFEERLKLAIKAKEAEFEKKKSVLALEIQNKARQLFV